MTDIKELVMSYLTALNTHDPDAWAALAADDIVYQVPNGKFEGKATVAAYLQTIWPAFHPVYDLDSISVYTGDDPGIAAITWTMEATFSSTYEGAPPTGKPATTNGTRKRLRPIPAMGDGAKTRNIVGDSRFARGGRVGVFFARLDRETANLVQIDSSGSRKDLPVRLDKEAKRRKVGGEWWVLDPEERRSK